MLGQASGSDAKTSAKLFATFFRKGLLRRKGYEKIVILINVSLYLGNNTRYGIIIEGIYM